MTTPITLEGLGRGALQEQFEAELQRLLENIMDPNTPATTKREIKIVVTVKPDKNRTSCAVTYQTTSKLAAQDPGETTLIVDYDRTKKCAVGLELDWPSENPGQHQLPTNVTPLKEKQGNE